MHNVSLLHLCKDFNNTKTHVSLVTNQDTNLLNVDFTTQCFIIANNKDIFILSVQKNCTLLILNAHCNK